MKHGLWILMLMGLCSILRAQSTFTASISYTPASCPTCCDGSAEVIMSGGMGCSPYIVMWSNGATTMMVTNVCPGPLTATVVSGNPGVCPTIICNASVTYSLATHVTETAGKINFLEVNNPVNDFLKISYSIESGDTFLDIQDIQGRVLESHRISPSEHTMSIQVSSLADGLYYVCLRQDHLIAARSKVVVSH